MQVSLQDPQGSILGKIRLLQDRRLRALAYDCNKGRSHGVEQVMPELGPRGEMVCPVTTLGIIR